MTKPINKLNTTDGCLVVAHSHNNTKRNVRRVWIP